MHASALLRPCCFLVFGSFIPLLRACGAAWLPSKTCCIKAVQLPDEAAVLRLPFILLCHHAHAARMLAAWVGTHTERGTGSLCNTYATQTALVDMIACRFATALTGPPREVALASDSKQRPRRVLSALAVAALVVWEVAADVARALWLLVLFAPLACTAPFALNGARRHEWLEYLRRAASCPAATS